MAEREQENYKVEEDVENNLNLDKSASVLAGLNLVLILSSISLSDEENPNFKEIEERESEKLDHKAKHSGLRPEGNGVHAVKKQKSNVRTKKREFRYKRRL